MKKAGQLMEEMGFNKDAPQATKEAFLKHLIKAATGNHVVTPSEEKEIETNKNKIIKMALPEPPEQLVFDFEKLIS